MCCLASCELSWSPVSPSGTDIGVRSELGGVKFGWWTGVGKRGVMCAMGGSSSGGALVRPATYLEELCEMGHLNDTLLAGYLVRLKSMQQLSRAQVEKALVHLQR